MADESTGYTPTEWKDGPDGGTPITAERLNNLEGGVLRANMSADTIDGKVDKSGDVMTGNLTIGSQEQPDNSGAWFGAYRSTSARDEPSHMAVGLDGAGNVFLNEGYWETPTKFVAQNSLTLTPTSTTLGQPLAVGSGGTGAKSFTGNSGLLSAMFDNTLNSGTLNFPVFTAGYADGGYMSNSQLKTYLGVNDSGWKTIESGGWTVQYRKWGKVVGIRCKSAKSSSTSWITCPTVLPAEYRPVLTSTAIGAVVGAGYTDSTGGDHTSYYYISEEGKVQVQHYGGANTYVRFECCYLV